MGRGEAYTVLVRKPEGKRKFGRHVRRWGLILKWIFKKEDGGR
jgi:hypothetical protein